jgi:TrmH RNA methyltransferase
MKPAKKKEEMRVYGRHAVLKLFEKRPHDIIRLYLTQEGVFDFKPIVRYCVDHKLAYHVVTTEELDTLTKATHHEGVALIVKTKRLPAAKDLLSEKGKSLILALEEVQNPHNLGAIMRTAAHFGVTGIIYQAKVPVALTGAAYRTSEGGAESVPAIHVENLSEILDLAKTRGYETYATSSHTGESLFKTKFHPKSILFIGAEASGLSDKIQKKMNHFISIPGTGEVESLNVSNATASILTEWFRQSL